MVLMSRPRLDRQEMGFKVEHQPIAWDGIVSSLIGKEIDLIAFRDEHHGERKKQVYFTIPYWKIRQVLIVRKDSKVTRKTAMAHHNKIGVQQDTMEARWIDENLIKKARKKFTLVYYDSTSRVIEDVISGRIDAAVTNDASARDAVKKTSIMILGLLHARRTIRICRPSRGQGITERAEYRTQAPHGLSLLE